MSLIIIYDEGEVMPYTNSSGTAISAAAPLLVGAKVGAPLADIAANGGTGNIAMVCAVSYAKNTGAGTGGGYGVDAYWDNTAKKFTAVTTSNTKVGYFWAPCLDADTTCSVKLLG